jgi:endonuclease/exonuclease/phosphatase family metal-dependent hydrolase
MVIHELRERLHHMAADVLFLQEVQGVARPPRRAASTTGRGKPQHEFIADQRLARGRRTARTRSTATAIHGNALLVALP